MNATINPLHYEIHSVQDYISMIEDLPYGQGGYYFRGENRRYVSQSSSLLRSEMARMLRDNPEYYADVVNDYARDMADQAGVWEREHVLAWCHHEGLPTNLLELTTSPLRALYFACLCRADDSEVPSQEGYVYGYGRENTVDVTDLILENAKTLPARCSLLEALNRSAGAGLWLRPLYPDVDQTAAYPQDLARFPYLTYRAPFKYSGSDETNSLYFVQLFQLNPTPDQELSHELIEQPYEPSLIIKVSNQAQIRRELESRIGL